MKKKAQIQQLQPIITGLVAIALVLVIGFLIMGTINDQSALQGSEDGAAVDCGTGTNINNSAACNASLAVVSAMDDIPGWIPIIVIVVIGALLIGLVRYFK